MISSNKSTKQTEYPRTTLVVSCLVLLLWLVVGMFTFHFVESANENNEQQNQDNITITKLIDNRQHQDLSFLENAVIVAAKTFSNKTSTYTNYTFIHPTNKITARKYHNTSKFDLSGSLFFSLTVVTTIGYGNLAPATDLGKFCCVAYAIIGIPLCFNVTGQLRKAAIRLLARMHGCSYKLAKFYPKCCHRNKNKASEEQDGSKLGLLQRKAWVATFVISLVVFYAFFLASSSLIHYVEGWSLLTSFYYSFITLTTIGFGDLIAGQNRPLFKSYWNFACYRFFLISYIFCGMALASWIIQGFERLTERIINRLVCWVCHHFSRNNDNNISGDSTAAMMKSVSFNDKVEKLTNLLDGGERANNSEISRICEPFISSQQQTDQQKATVKNDADL